MLSVQNISKKFTDDAGEFFVLHDLSFSIARGEMVGLIGVSGAGKTTLLQILGGLDTATSGIVEIDGHQLCTMKLQELARFRNRSIGFVFQFHHLLPDFSALENVVIPGMIGGKSKKECMEKARYLLDIVGLSHRLTHVPSELSGGERQRVALARALFNDPALILADEPTGNLDTKNTRTLLDFIHATNEKLNQTFLVATHNSQLSEGMHRTLFIEDGTIAR